MKTIYLKDSNKEVLQEMQHYGLNVTTCGDCGAVKLHRISRDLEQLECEECGLVSDPCDFPDLEVVSQ